MRWSDVIYHSQAAKAADALDSLRDQLTAIQAELRGLMTADLSASSAVAKQMLADFQARVTAANVAAYRQVMAVRS